MKNFDQSNYSALESIWFHGIDKTRKCEKIFKSCPGKCLVSLTNCFYSLIQYLLLIWTCQNVLNLFLNALSWELVTSCIHSHKKLKDRLETRTIDIFAWTWNIWHGLTENTSKQPKMVAYVRNCLVKMTLRLF